MERLNEPIKVGRIARSTERALGLSLTGEVSIYIAETELDAIARKMPTGYLRFLQEVTSILKNPDFVCFDQKKEEFAYMRFYFKGGSFSSLYLYVGRGQEVGKWYFKRCVRHNKATLPDDLAGKEFYRPVAKRSEKELESA